MTGTITKTPDHKSIFAALAAAQAAMEGVKKDAKNDAFKRDGKASAYATLSSALEACLPALNANGICVMQPPGEDETGRFVRTIFAHISGETVECKVPLIVSKNDMQGYGSAVTYARRYGLMSMAGIAPEDDDGNAAAKAPPRAEDTPMPPKMALDVAMQSIANADGLDALAAIWRDLPKSVKDMPAVAGAKDARKAALTPKVNADLGGDEIPY